MGRRHFLINWPEEHYGTIGYGTCMKQLILILGGARSGKSSYAQKLALELGGPDVLYVATAEPLDEEMRRRISVHRAERPSGWRTLEAAQAVAAATPPLTAGRKVVLVDCLTLLTSNILLAQGENPDPQQAEAAVLAEVEALLRTARATDAVWILVSNEVGLGLVPPYALGRLYRDALGRVNQCVAAAADQVVFMVAGLPMKVKQTGHPPTTDPARGRSHARVRIRQRRHPADSAPPGRFAA